MKKLLNGILMMVVVLGMVTSAMACTEWCGDLDYDMDENALPTSAELHTDAYLLGDDMIGRTLRVLRSGYVRTAPNQSSRIITDAFPSDEVAIIGYHMESANPLNMWLKVDFYGMEAWINASRGKIVCSAPDPYTPGNDPLVEMWRSRYVGQIMRVNVKSGYARSGPGPNYPKVDYIERPDTYEMIDVALDEQGNLWVKIRGGANYCWARASLFSSLSD